MKKKTTMSFDERDIWNLIEVIGWGLSGLEDEELAEQLETLLKRFRKAEDRLHK